MDLYSPLWLHVIPNVAIWSVFWFGGPQDNIALTTQRGLKSDNDFKR